MKSALNQHVLVLNRLWQAVNVCTARRALTLLFQGQAQVVMNNPDGSFRTFSFQEWRDVSADAPHDDSIHAISFRIRVPTPKCDKCGNQMEMEELEDEFFAWLDASAA